MSAVLYSTACKFMLFVPYVLPAHEATSGNCAWFNLIGRWQLYQALIPAAKKEGRLIAGYEFVGLVAENKVGFCK